MEDNRLSELMSQIWPLAYYQFVLNIIIECFVSKETRVEKQRKKGLNSKRGEVEVSQGKSRKRGG